MFNGTALNVLDKTEQMKIYRWFAFGNEPVTVVRAEKFYVNSTNADEKQDYFINRNSVAFMTFED
jgi:hypothetical protein